MQISKIYRESSETVLLKITGTAHPIVILTNIRITTWRHTRNHISFNSSLYVGISIRLLRQRRVPEGNRFNRPPNSDRDMTQVGGAKERLSSTKSKICNIFSEALQGREQVTHRVLCESVDY